MSESLGQRPWMTAPATAAVLDALEAAGGPDCARFVGGCVRNALIGAAIDDIDIATRLLPGEVTTALEAAGLRAVPTGVEHGTVTAISGSRPFEITTLRRDVETDGRRAVVAFTDDWAQDAARRDFTLNALYARRDGTICDPTGRGVEDGRAGRIVFVGEAERRIGEDYLRILRFFRFFAWYGRGEPDAAALAACAALKDGVANLAAERVTKELLKLLAADDPVPALRLMDQAGVLARVLPGAVDIGRLEGLVVIEREQLMTADPLLRLAALAAPETLTKGLRLSNAERDRVQAARDAEPVLKSWMSPKEIRRAVHALGAQAFRDRAKLAWAADPRGASAAQWLGLIALGDGWSPPSLPISGEDIIAAGVPKGPRVGEVMREVEAWWIDQDFPEDRLAAIEKLKAVAQGISR